MAYQSESSLDLHIENPTTPKQVIVIAQWGPDLNQYDDDSKNAMAVRGYYDAFQQVKNCILKIINGNNAAKIVKDNLQIGYQHLFGPAAQAGIIPPEASAHWI